MDNHTLHQVGSPSRDIFKRKHKDLDRSFYACDIDFVLVTKTPTPDIIAVIDYKKDGDDVSFSEVIAYNALTRRGISVFIATGDQDSGQLVIERYLGGHHAAPSYHLDFVIRTETWKDFGLWEKSVREEYETRFGPPCSRNGSLKHG